MEAEVNLEMAYCHNCNFERCFRYHRVVDLKLPITIPPRLQVYDSDITRPYNVLYSNSIRCLWLLVLEHKRVMMALESQP